MVTVLGTEIQNRSIEEKRITFHNLSWQAYQQISSALGESCKARLTFDRDTLEMVMPLEVHEFAARLIERFIIALAVELRMPIKTMGSTTLDREDLLRGAEPDDAYYIQNQPLVAGRDINLQNDPPPDLIVEIDITHTDINKLSLYAAFGVPEFWRYDGQVWRIYQLQGEYYLEVEASPTFPNVPKQRLYSFLEQARLDEIGAEVDLRAWVRQELLAG